MGTLAECVQPLATPSAEAAATTGGDGGCLTPFAAKLYQVSTLRFVRVKKLNKIYQKGHYRSSLYHYFCYHFDGK